MVFLSHSLTFSSCIPHSISSNSLSSKNWSQWRGTTSLNPSRNALVCSCTPLFRRHWRTNLRQEERGLIQITDKATFLHSFIVQYTSLAAKACQLNTNFSYNLTDSPSFNSLDVLLLVLPCDQDALSPRLELM